jgi:hypothetical protein
VEHTTQPSRPTNFAPEPIRQDAIHMEENNTTPSLAGGLQCRSLGPKNSYIPDSTVTPCFWIETTKFFVLYPSCVGANTVCICWIYWMPLHFPSIKDRRCVWGGLCLAYSYVLFRCGPWGERMNCGQEGFGKMSHQSFFQTLRFRIIEQASVRTRQPLVRVRFAGMDDVVLTPFSLSR